GSTSAETVFAATATSGGSSEATTARAIITAHRREINRIRGYKLQLTPTETERLRKIQEKVVEISRKASAGTVREDELADRDELLEEADRIIGKPTVDLEVDDKLAEYNALKVALLEPKLDPATKRRVEFLERYKASLEEEVTRRPESASVISRLQTVAALIDDLKPLRLTTELSPVERRTYDDIVELINDHVGRKVELTARESDRVIALERSIDLFEARVGPDLSQQPTPQAVSRAYTALAL
ncbi:MAG: hypothetical protein D6773_12350, partial [Alphaproteobacteria bacterium]